MENPELVLDMNTVRLAPRNVMSLLVWYRQFSDIESRRVMAVEAIANDNPDTWLRLSEAMDFIELTVGEHITKSSAWVLTGAVLDGVDPLNYWCDWEYQNRAN